MSYKIGNVAVIAEEPTQECQFCGKQKECRPYGPGCRQICYECGTRTPEMKATIERNMDRKLFGGK